jgi:asparagine synthase (glutamine-hydrolysing)
MTFFVGMLHANSLPIDQHLQELTVPNLAEPSSRLFIQDGPFHCISHGASAATTPNVLVLFSGCLYNERQLYETHLSKHVPILRSTEQLIALLYEKYKENVFSQLKGSFAIAIFDKMTSQLLIGRDRLGERSLYWSFRNNMLIFSTHLKTILSSKWISKDLDIESLSFYISLGYLPQEKTPIKEVYKLQPGHYLRYADGANLQIRPFWSYNSFLIKKNPSSTYPDIQTSSLHSWIEKTRLSSEKGLICFNEQEKHSLFSLLSQNLNFNTDFCYLSIFSEQEDKYLSSLEPGSLRSELEQAIWVLEEPDANPETFSTWFLFKELAQKNIKHAYFDMGSTGWIQSKLFFQSPRFSSHWTSIRSWIKKQFFIPFLHFFQPKLAYHVLRSLNTHPWHKAFLHQNCLFPRTEVLALDSHFLHPIDPEIFLHRFPALEKLKASPEALLYLFFKTSLSPSWLTPLQKFGLFFGVNAHCPFFDPEVVQTTASLPHKMFKQLFSFHKIQQEKPSVSLSLLEKNCHKFSACFQDLAKGVLVENGIISPRWVLKKMPLVSKDLTVFHRMWSLLILEIWIQTFIEKKFES